MNASSEDRSATKFTPEQLATIRLEVDSVLSSQLFSGSKRCQEFLKSIVQHAVEGQYDSLTERFLGVELFGRSLDYDTGTDSIVRVRANDVRRRLTEHYANHSAESKVIIHLPAGSYVPEFEWPIPFSEELAEASSAIGSNTNLHSSLSTSTEEQVIGGHNHSPTAAPRPKSRWGISMAVAVLILLVAFSAGWWINGNSMKRQLHPWRYEPAMDSLWSGLLSPSRNTDIILSDTSYQLLEEITQKSFTLDQYRNRTYLDQPQANNQSPAMTRILNMIASKSFGNSVEFRLAQRISALDPAHSMVHVYNAREFTASLLTQDNVILIGSQHSNPWQQLFESNVNFVESHQTDSYGVIINRHPLKGEQAIYTPTSTVGYCIVAYLPSLGGDTKALLVEGSSSEATDAAGDFLLSEGRLAHFLQMIHAKKMPYFQVLLKTSQVQATPIAASIIAYRTYSQ